MQVAKVYIQTDHHLFECSRCKRRVTFGQHFTVEEACPMHYPDCEKPEFGFGGCYYGRTSYIAIKNDAGCERREGAECGLDKHNTQERSSCAGIGREAKDV